MAVPGGLAGINQGLVSANQSIVTGLMGDSHWTRAIQLYLSSNQKKKCKNLSPLSYTGCIVSFQSSLAYLKKGDNLLLQFCEILTTGPKAFGPD